MGSVMTIMAFAQFSLTLCSRSDYYQYEYEYVSPSHANNPATGSNNKDFGTTVSYGEAASTTIFDDWPVESVDQTVSFLPLALGLLSLFALLTAFLSIYWVCCRRARTRRSRWFWYNRRWLNHQAVNTSIPRSEREAGPSPVAIRPREKKRLSPSVSTLDGEGLFLDSHKGEEEKDRSQTSQVVTAQVEEEESLSLAPIGS